MPWRLGGGCRDPPRIPPWLRACNEMSEIFVTQESYIRRRGFPDTRPRIVQETCARNLRKFLASNMTQVHTGSSRPIQICAKRSCLLFGFGTIKSGLEKPRFQKRLRFFLGFQPFKFFQTSVYKYDWAQNFHPGRTSCSLHCTPLSRLKVKG